MIPIGQRLRRFRKSKGITQDELAEKMGITQGTLSDIEGKDFPPMERFCQICEILDIEPYKVWLDDPVTVLKFMPDWVTEKDLDILYKVNTQISPELAHHFYKIMADVLDALAPLSNQKPPHLVQNHNDTKYDPKHK